MSLTALVNGTLFTQAKSISVHRSLRNFVGYFDLVSSANERNALPIQLGDAIKILANDRVLLTGFVESLSVRQAADDHEIRISGRDITADLVDSSLKVKQFTGPIELGDLIRRVLQAQGLSFKIVNEAGALRQIKATELVSGQIGQSAFGFLETYARHVQALLTTNAVGDIVILRASPVFSGATLLRQKGNDATNILASSLDLNNADRFGEYVCQGQVSGASEGQSIFAEQTVAQSGSAFDPEIRAGRFLEFESETTLDSDACKDRASLEANVRRAASLDYRATVQGIPAGVEINRTVTVEDDLCQINDQLLITEVDHHFDLNSGTTTGVAATFRDAFTLDEAVSRIDTARSETAKPFILKSAA